MPVEVEEAHQSESSIEPVFGVSDGEDVLANLDFDPFLAEVEPYGPGFDFGPYPEEQPLYINAKQFHYMVLYGMTSAQAIQAATINAADLIGRSSDVGQLTPGHYADLIALTDYGGPLAAIIGRDNLVGTQFHPEKSQEAGLRLIGNFLRWRP